MQALKRFLQYVATNVQPTEESEIAEVFDLCDSEELYDPQDLAHLLTPEPRKSHARRSIGDDASDEAVLLLGAAAKAARRRIPAWTHLQQRLLEKDMKTSAASGVSQDIIDPYPRPGGLPSASAVKAAKSRLEKVFRPGAHIERPRPTLTQPLSLRDKIRQADDVVIKHCFALLEAIGDDSPRYRKMFNAGPPSESMVLIQADFFAMGIRNLAVVNRQDSS